MAKALKTAAIVVGVAALAVVTGGAAAGLGLSLATTFVVGGAYVSAGALALGAAALSVGSALLTKKPSVTAAQTDRLFANVTPRAFRKTPLGSTALPVDVRYEEWSGKDQEYCDWIVEHASCAIDGVEEIWFDTELAWTAGAGAIGKYRGYFSVPNLILEGTTANAFTFGAGKWNAATARLVGCAYARWRFKVTGNSKKVESPFASGLPSRITIIGRGAKLYDPRRDSTVPGGSGPMRATDQTTWRFTADDGVVIGDNLPLQILRVVLGWRIRNPVTGEMLLATGSGVPPRRLRLPSWITSANIADELVNRSAGGQEPRYHGAAVVSEGDDTKQTLDMLCAGCCGRFRDTQGKLALDIAHNDLAAIATDEGLLDDDVIGGFTWDPDPGFDGIPNVIRGQYVDATTGSLYQLLDYPEVRIASPDGVDRVRTVDLGAVESPSQAQRIVKQILQRALFNRKFSAPFDIRAWKYPVGAVLPFTFAALGFVRVAFRVEAQELGQDGVCNMTLSFEHPAIYSWDKDDAAPVIAADPIVYDASKNPLILAIDDAGKTSEWSGVSGSGKPADNADVTRDNTAKDTLAVGGRSVADVLADLGKIEPIDEAQKAADRTILDAQLLAEERRQRYEDLMHLDGEQVGAVLKKADLDRIDGDRRITETISLIGQKSADGGAFILNGATFMVAPGQSLAQRLSSLSSITEDDVGSIVSSRITTYDEVLTSKTGAIAQSVSALEAKMTGPNGSIAGAITAFDRLTIDANDPTSRPIAESVKSLRTTVNGQTSDIKLILRTLGGDEAVAQLILTADGKISGVRFKGSNQSVAFDVKSFSLVDPSSGLRYFFADADGRVLMHNVEVDTIKAGAIDSPSLKEAAVSRSNFATVQNDVACYQSVQQTVVSFDFVKLDASSALKVQMFAQCYHADDLQFDADILLDGQQVQRATVRMPFDNSNSRGQAPITPSAFLTGIPAGQHNIAFALTSHETEGPTYVRSGSTLEVTELRGAAVASARQTSDGGSGGGGTGGGSDGGSGGGGGGAGGGGTNEEVLQ
ncbi:hypothetical protein [uncultured Sphingomonas sp.]|uniref:hypothetical protein n=1 Tax=uncultured Sphingomonas sp. TaxID=158754 RepID=UPI0025E115AC|nr:hypothetical protein [uncultured Sphingomonas sp.]